MFEVYLVREGLITAEDLVEVLEHQLVSRPSIKELAVTSGLISKSQAVHLADLQATAHRRFGDLAIELGYLTDDALNRLLRHQASIQKTLEEVLIARGILNAAMLRDAQARYYGGAKLLMKNPMPNIDAALSAIEPASTTR